MVYKKFLKVNGKTYGPYLYESYRENGRVKKRYISGSDKITKPIIKNNSNFFTGKRTLVFVSVLLLLGVFIFVLLHNFGLTGRASLEMKDSYIAGENISGILNLVLKQGELIPAGAKVSISQNGQTKEFIISDLISANNSGQFYVEGQNISGSGNGVGLSGSRIIYPNVYFTLLLSSGNQAEVIPGGQNETSTEKRGTAVSPTGQNETGGPAAENISTPTTAPESNTSSAAPTEQSTIAPAETPAEQPTTTPTAPNPNDQGVSPAKTVSSAPNGVSLDGQNEQNGQKTAPAENTPTEQQTTSEASAPAESSPITGAVILDNGGEQVGGIVSANTTFEYITDKSAQVIEAHIVRLAGVSPDGQNENLSADVLNLVQQNGKIGITTGYAYSESGFGKDFAGTETDRIPINLSSFGVLAEDGAMSIQLSYGGLVLAEISQQISVVNNTIVNETLINVTTANFSIIQNIDSVVEENTNYTLNLGDYFAGAEYYTSQNVSNISLVVDSGNLIIIPDANWTGKRSAQVIAYAGNQSLSQTFMITVASPEKYGVITKQYKAVINQPVKWLKIVNVTNASEINLEIPKEAENISIKTGSEVDKAIEDADNSESVVNGTSRRNILTGNVVMTNEGTGVLSRLWRWISSLGFTGRVIADINTTQTPDSQAQNSGVSPAGQIVDLTSVGNQTMAVEYSTPAPISVEEDTNNGKRIVISSAGEYNYTDILAYASVPNIVSVENNKSIKLIWHASYNDAVTYGYIVPSVPVEENASAPPASTPFPLPPAQTGENLSINTSLGNDTSLINNSNETLINNSSGLVNSSVNLSEVIVSSNSSMSGESTLAENLTKKEEKELANEAPKGVSSAPNGVSLDGQNEQNEQNNKNGKEAPGQVKKGITGNVILGEDVPTENNSVLASAPLYIDLEVSFDAYDLDADGMVDYVEWNVPHLSNQTYEIILITKAEHLDENYTFIEDVYDSVKAIDNSSVVIPSGDYLRVTFEQNLTNKKDITIYASRSALTSRNVSVGNESVPYDVYAMKKRIDEIRGELNNYEVKNG